MSNFRVDIGTLRPPERLADGRLRVEGHLTRSGVFTYRNPDGTERREYRPAIEVFKADSMHTFRDAIVTDDHPPEMITAKNAKEFGVGMISGAPRRDEDHVAATLVIGDAATIAKVEGGKVQLSCGYECDLDTTPGVTPEGERYDARQLNIRGNHVAIVDVARAGHTARVRMDAAAMVASDPIARQESTVNLEQALAALAAANEKLGAEKVRTDAIEAARAELATKLTLAEQSAAAEKTRADKADKARTDASAGEAARVRARIELETKAAKVLGDEFKADAPDRDLMVACVKRIDNFDVPADADEAAVKLCFASAVTRADAGAEGLAAVRTATETTRTDAGASDEVAARKRMIERNQNAYKAQKEGK